AGAETKTLRIDTWLMSCRVIGRSVEHFIFGTLLERSRELGYQTIVGEFIPTKKNALVSGLYQELGFSSIPNGNGGAICYELDLKTACRPRTFVHGKAD